MALFNKPRKVGRPSHEPHRDTVPYARLQNIFSAWNGGRDRPLVKATPARLRNFAKNVYARRAIKVIKDSIATKPFEVVARDGVTPNPELDKQCLLVATCLSKPNNDDSWRSLLEQLIEDICVCGAGAAEHQSGGDALRPLWIWPVDALAIQIVPGWDGDVAKPRYFQSLGYGNVGTQRGIPLRNDELVYMRYDPSTETPFGLGPLEVAFATINRQLSAAEYAGNVAGNASAENLLFFKNADDAQLQAIRNYWQNEIEGQGKMPIFGSDDLKVEHLRGNTDAHLFLAYQELLIREIAAAFGISPQNLAIERDVNRDTAEVAEDRDYRQTIIPMADLITSYINREVIEGQLGFSQIELKIQGLDREDELDTAKIMDLRWKTNSITADEIRGRYGEAPIDGPWGSMTKADIDIAISAARGAQSVDDPELQPASPAPADTKRRKPKGR